MVWDLPASLRELGRYTIMATHLSFKTFSIIAEESRCIDCKNWCGCCRQGKKNRIARSEACEIFEPKYSAMYVIPEIVEVKA